MDLQTAQEALAVTAREYAEARRVRATVCEGTPGYREAVHDLGIAWYRWRMARDVVKRLQTAP